MGRLRVSIESSTKVSMVKGFNKAARGFARTGLGTIFVLGFSKRYYKEF